MMLVGANGREVVQNVKAKLAQISPSLPQGVHIDTFYDRADLVNRTIKTVATNLAEGALFGRSGALGGEAARTAQALNTNSARRTGCIAAPINFS